MPRKQYLSRQDYDEDQGHQLPPRMVNGEKVGAMMVSGTHPAGMRYHYYRPWVSIIEAMEGFQTPLVPGSNVGMIGAGFGWDAEVVASLGYNVVSVETSTYVEQVKDTSYETDYRAHLTANGLDPDSGPGATILAEWMLEPRTKGTILHVDLGKNAGRKAIKDALGIAANANLDWAISCNVLPVLDDNEAQVKPKHIFSLFRENLLFSILYG